MRAAILTGVAVVCLVMTGCRTGGHCISVSRCASVAVTVYSGDIEAQQGKTVAPKVDATIPAEAR